MFIPPTTAIIGEVNITCFIFSLSHECHPSADHTAPTGIASRWDQRKGVGRVLCRC